MSADTALDDRATCDECGSHLSTAWRRVWRDNDGDPGLCRDCASRTDRFGTSDAVGADLSALRSPSEPLYTAPPEPTAVPTTYAGPACCLLCRRGLDRGRRILWHLLETHTDVAIDLLDLEASPDA